ncbi:MAG: sensor histidine kinase N-terminal domain-containing protein [Duodenibacillus sp.]|nr:sensor histidine kinase N-terminal domain-containing protein [Duodenibacillus sp.]
MASIRGKIVFTLVSALAAAGFVASWATFTTTRAEFSAAFDEQLRHTALALAETASADRSAVDLLARATSNQVFIQIFDASDNTLYRSAPVKHACCSKPGKGEQAAPMPLAEVRGFHTVELEDGVRWRQFALAVGSRIIQVAQPVAVRTDLAMTSAMRILQPTLILIPFIAIAIWLVIVQALDPLRLAARAVAQRSPSSLSPIVIEKLPHELASLVDAINALLARLAESLSAQQRFASDAAHELRTPLAGIRLQAQLLSRARTPEQTARHADRLQQGVARATRLVEQLLTIARLDPEAAIKPFGSVDLASLARQSAEELQHAAEAKGIALTARADAAVTVEGMADALRLMMTNLADNAIRYTPEGGRIEISVRLDGRRALVRVADDGPGIAPEERERVFERFYRGLGTKVQGTGLGLAIVKRIVDMHGGSIRVEDGFEREDAEGARGCGACFAVGLPVSPDHEAARG